MKEVFRNPLRKRLDNLHVPGSRLHGGLANYYKIKLGKQGYRLVYTVEDNALIVLVTAVDKREVLAAYKSAIKRLLEKTGAGSRNRTRDLLITNQLLYQLSYAGVLMWLRSATGILVSVTIHALRGNGPRPPSTSAALRPCNATTGS